MATITRRLDPVYSGETWQEDILVTDENNHPFDLVGSKIKVEVFRPNSRSAGLTASMGAGVAMPATGVVEWVFSPGQTASLCAGVHSVKITVSRDGAVLVLENFRLPVLSGVNP